MMDDNKFFLEYKKFIEENSIYKPRVVKKFTAKSSYFPIIDFQHEDSLDTYNRTLDRIEYYDDEYFRITIYAQDIGTLSRNVIIDELKQLTHIFMGIKYNMSRTSCKPLTNMDADIGRLVMKYQGRWGNVYGNIWRR